MLACGHDDPSGGFATCAHVEAGKPFVERFTGKGTETEILCTACRDAPGAIVRVCGACLQAIREQGDLERYLGEPGIVVEPSTLRFAHLPPQTLRVAPLLDLRPRLGGDRDLWIGLTAHRELVELDLDTSEVRRLAMVPEELFRLNEHEHLEPTAPREPPPLTLHVSRDGAMAAVLQQDHGLVGAVIDLETGAQLMPLLRDYYCCEHCVHSFAFVEHGGRTLVIHASDWNRLDVHDPRTSTLLTARGPTSYTRDQDRPPHYLDYFHCGLSVSPDHQRIVDNGWVWQPDNVITTWQIEPWLTSNVWESEDGPTKKMLCWRGEWDQPLVWIDNTHVAIWGYGQDHKLIPAVRIFDTETARETSWFAGPRGELVFDRVLVSMDRDHGAAVWNVERGSRLAHEPVSPTRYHPTAKTFLRFDGSTVIRSRLLGLAAALAAGVIGELAERIAREHAFGDLPVLGDALEAAGCTDREMLAHCQQPGDHADRCWVLERLRG